MVVIIHATMVTALIVWVVAGTILTVVAVVELFSTAKQARRQAWRHATLDRATADARADFFRTNLAFLAVILAVMIAWPLLLARTLQAPDSEA